MFSFTQSDATTERIALHHAATTDLKHEYYPLTSVSNSSTSTSTVTHLLRPRGQYTAGVGDRLGIKMLSRNDTNGRSTRPFLSQSEPTRESVTFLQNTRARSQSRVAVAAASSARREAKTKTYDVDGGDGLRSSVNQARIAPSAEPRRVAKMSPVVTAQWDGCGREDPRPRWMSAALRTSNDEHNSREVQRRNNITGPMFGGCVTAELDGMAEDSLRLSIGDDSFVTASPTAWRGDASMTTSDISAAAADERRRTCSMQESAVTQTDGGHPEGIPRSRSLDTGCTTPQAMWGADEEQGRSSDATTPRLSGRAYGFRGDDGISFLPMLASGGGNGLVHGRSSNEDRSALRCPSFVVGSNNGASDRRVTSFTSPNVSSLSSSTDQAPSASTLETTQFAFSVETSQHSTDVHSNHSGSGTNNSGTVSMARRKAGIYQPQRVLVGGETRSAEMSRGALYRRSSVAILRKLFPGPTPEKSERGVSTHPGAGAALHDFGLWETVENIPAFSSENECTGKSSGLSPQALPNPSDAVWLKRAASPPIAREGRAARLPSPDGRGLIMGVALLESSDGERTGVRRASIAFDRTSEAVSTNAASSFVASASVEDELQDVKDAGVERWSGRSLNRVGYNLYSDDNAYLSDDRRSASSSDKDINYSDALQTTPAVGRHTTDDTPNTNEGDEVETQRSDGHNGVSVVQGDHDAHHHHHIAATQQAQLVCPHAPQISPRVLSPPVPQATNQPRVHHGTARGLARSSEAGAPSRCRTCRRKGEKLMSEGGRSRAVEETVADIDVSRARKSIQGRTWQYSTRELDAEGSKLVHLGTAGGMGQLTPSDLWATEEGCASLVQHGPKAYVHLKGDALIMNRLPTSDACEVVHVVLFVVCRSRPRKVIVCSVFQPRLSYSGTTVR